MTSFIGRRQELADLRRALSSYRLVTLTGVGGVGKTRLALRMAETVRRAFRDGVWFVDFSAVADPSLLIPTIRTALGLRDMRAEEPTDDWQQDQLISYLADLQTLLILDNCEHMAGEAGVLIETLLRSCPELRILATSRHRLGVEGESTMQVPSLSIPSAEHPAATAEALTQYEAVNLLVERATAVVPEFSVNSGNYDAVASLCQRLDGIPLAIEFAAVRLRALSVGEMLDRLEERYGLMRKASPAAMPRQQTLRALMDWSFDLLSAEERLLWARLSIFAGSFTLEAVEGICGDASLPPQSAATLLSDLMDKSVVVREDDGSTVRYRLLETIKSYGRDHLRESGEEQELLSRQLHWYRDLVDRAHADSFGPEHAAWCARLRAEHPNLRAALEHSLTEPLVGLHLAGALRPYWLGEGALAEGRQWLERLLPLAPEPGVDRAEALIVAAHLVILLGFPAEAQPMLTEARSIADSLGDRAVMTAVIEAEGVAEVFGGEPSRVLELTGRALAEYRAVNDDFGKARTLLTLAYAWTMLGDFTQGRATCQETLAICEAHNERWLAGLALWTQGLVAWFQHDIQQVKELQRRSIRLREPYRDLWTIAMALEQLAWVASAEKQHRHAAQLFGVLKTMWHSIGGFLPRALVGEHDRCETETREALGTRAFETAFREGERLPVDKAIAFALGETIEAAKTDAAAGPVTAQLTRRETEIAQLIAAGLSNKEIAARLVIAQRTAEGHVEHILAKLGFNSRSQVAAWVAQTRSTEAREDGSEPG
jgi:predicted ATPase/DNA-binding CsgD family transcriptional regulator